jgi:hypothetical protein
MDECRIKSWTVIKTYVRKDRQYQQLKALIIKVNRRSWKRKRKNLRKCWWIKLRILYPQSYI